MARQRPTSSEPAPPALTGAQRVGGDLRAARERLGWSMPDTSAYVRIRLPFLQALEEGRVQDLPGPAYVTGFVRSYALALGVDAEAMVRRYRDDIGTAPVRVALDFPKPVPQRHVPAGTVVMLGALMAIGAYVGWYRASDEHPQQVAVQQVPARLAPLALPVVPPPPKLAANAATPQPLPQVAAAYVPPGAAEAGVPAPGSLSPIEPVPIATAANAVSPATRVVLNATADAWVQVKAADGSIVLSKVMHAGDSWAVPNPAPDAGPMLLTTGNAGGTVLTVDGSILPALGGDGVVKRDVALDPTQLKNGMAAAQAAPQN